MKKLQSKLPIILALVVAVFGLVVWAVVASQPDIKPQTNQSTEVQIPAKNRTEITYTAKAGLTSLAQLQDEASEVIIKESEFGQYVDSIEGHQGGTDGKYWSFYVDGQMSEVGAGSYTQKGGEVIEWKFQKL